MEQAPHLEQTNPMSPAAPEADSLPVDATHVESDDVLFGGRKAGLYGLSVRFQAQAEPASWQRLLRELKLEPGQERKRETATFTALPPAVKELHPCLTGVVSFRPDKPSHAQWEFSWYRAPDEPPPKGVLTASARVGGFPTVLDTLASFWPTSAPLQARVSATYFIPAAQLHLRFPSMRPRRVRSGEQVFRVLPARWVLEPPSGPVREIVRKDFKDLPDLFVLTAKGRYTLNWTRHFLNEVDGAVWGGLSRFLTSR